MDALVLLIPLLPFLAAAAIGVGHLFGRLNEQITTDLAVWSVALAFFMAAALLVGDGLGKTQGLFSLGQWLASDTLDIRITFISSGFRVALVVLFALLLALIGQFAVGFLHGEPGFQRFFFLYSLFSAAWLAMLLSANMVGTLIGWMLSGWCAFGLVGHVYQRPVATANATRVLISNRIGDAGFIVGISLCYAGLQDINWQGLHAAAAELSIGQATGISLCFALAACAKSAQLPFTLWLSKALEGPPPADALVYGAVTGHAGVFLLCMVQPVLSQSPFALAVLGLVGIASAAYGQLVGLSQTDVKSALAYASSAQIGLMFLECALGFWQLAEWHLCAHAIVRCLQFLHAPALVAAPAKPALEKTVPRWLFTASLQQFWLEQIADWTLLKPIHGLALDLSYFDSRVIDPLLGMPNLDMEHWPQAEQEHRLQSPLKPTGVAGKLTKSAATVMHWFENRLLIRGLNKQGFRYGHELGRLTNKFEHIILRPRYLVLFICITFLMAF